MYLKNLLTIAGISALTVIVGCASRPQKVSNTDSPRKSYTEEAEGASITNAAAKEAGAHNFVEIEFKPGSATLDENAKTSLKSVLAQAKSSGKINEVIVLSWADAEYPAKDAKLSKPQNELADRRNKSIAKYLKDIQSVDVDSYNMAKQPGAFSKWFNTTDTKLKNSLVAAGLPTTADDPKYPSKASHSVILVTLD